MRIGVDLGGTKIEAIAIADDGGECGNPALGMVRRTRAGKLPNQAPSCGLEPRIEPTSPPVIPEPVEVGPGGPVARASAVTGVEKSGHPEEQGFSGHRVRFRAEEGQRQALAEEGHRDPVVTIAQRLGDPEEEGLVFRMSLGDGGEATGFPIEPVAGSGKQE